MKQPKSPSTFVTCPPPSLSIMLEGKGNEKADLFDEENEKIAFFDEACELQSRLREQLSQVRTELGLFLRLMYKNKNQHRRSLYYRRLSQVKRDLQLFSSSGLEAIVENLPKFASGGSSDSSRPAVRSKPLVHVVDETRAMHTLVGVARLLNQIYGPIMASSVQLTGLLGQSFFMPFALTMFCCLARFRVVLMQVLYEVVTAFNLLSAVRHYRNKIFPTVLDQSLPSQIECHWDGERLAMTERKVASTPECTVPDGVPFQESTAAWFVDDRTGAHYDLGSPATVAGEVLVASTANEDAKATSHEVERTEYGGANLGECLLYSHSFDPREDETGLSGNGGLQSSGNNSQVQDTKVFESLSSLVDVPATVYSGLVENTNPLESSGKSLSAFTENATPKQNLGTRREVGKKVAYISVGHKIALDRTNEKNVTQNSRDGTVKDVQQDVKAEVVEVYASDSHRRVDGDGGLRSPSDVTVPVGGVDFRHTGGLSSLSFGNTETMQESGTFRKDLKDSHLGMTDALNQKSVAFFSELESTEGAESTRDRFASPPAISNIVDAAAEYVSTPMKDDRGGDTEALADTTTSTEYVDFADTKGVCLKKIVDQTPEDSGQGDIAVHKVSQEIIPMTMSSDETDMDSAADKSLEVHERISAETEVVAHARGRTIDEGTTAFLSHLQESTSPVRRPSESNSEKPSISNSGPQGQSEENIEFSRVRVEVSKATSPSDTEENSQHHNALRSNETNLVEAPDQTATKSDEARSLGKSLPAGGELTKPSEDVNIPPNVKANRQNKKSAKRRVRNTSDSKKEMRQLNDLQRGGATPETRKVKSDPTRTSSEREAKKQKTNDIFAMLMGGLQ